MRAGTMNWNFFYLALQDSQIVEQFIIISSEKVKMLLKILVFFSNATIFFLLSTRPYTQYFPEPDKYRFTELQI